MYTYLRETPDELSLARYLELDWVQVMSPGTVPRLVCSNLPGPGLDSFL